MNYEISKTFDNELLTITLLTSIAIFVIVAISFRSLIIPALLVQCGIYITVTLLGVKGISIYYLALLMVECILMGIDTGPLHFCLEYQSVEICGQEIELMRRIFNKFFVQTATFRLKMNRYMGDYFKTINLYTEIVNFL